MIDRKRQLDQIAGEKLEPLPVPLRPKQFPTQGMEEERGKDQRQCNPDDAPDGSILESNFVRSAVKDAQVDGQHREDEKTEANPRQCRSREQMHLRLKYHSRSAFL